MSFLAWPCSMALPTKFQIKEYCPLVFRDLRERFDVSPEEFVVRHNPPFAPLAFLDSNAHALFIARLLGPNSALAPVLRGSAHRTICPPATIAKKRVLQSGLGTCSGGPPTPPLTIRDLAAAIAVFGVGAGCLCFFAQQAAWCNGPAEEITSPGKSNATFFTSHDKRFIIKSLNKEEVDLFHKIFPQYHTVRPPLSPDAANARARPKKTPCGSKRFRTKAEDLLIVAVLTVLLRRSWGAAEERRGKLVLRCGFQCPSSAAPPAPASPPVRPPPCMLDSRERPVLCF